MSKNDITGDDISSRSYTAQGQINYDNIFMKKSAAEWCDHLHPECVILDPDGWRYDNTSLETKINKSEFHHRFNMSTIGRPTPHNPK